MNKYRKYVKLFPVLILLFSLFMGIGYASVNSVILGFSGEMVAKIPKDLYITDVRYNNDNNANVEESKILHAFETNLTSYVSLADDDLNSTITYTVTIKNATDSNYYFNRVDYLVDEDTYSNSDIQFDVSLKKLDLVRAGESITFNITFKYLTDEIINNILRSSLNFKFSLGTSINYTYTGNFQTFVAPKADVYKLEAWGSQGGNYSDTYTGGRGGYSTGVVSLSEGEELFVYVGGKGKMTEVTAAKIAAGGYNGGGASSKKNTTDTKYKNVSGGGATDFRLISGDALDSASLYSRILVAGGGSGSSYYSSSRVGYGGAGGGLVGKDGTSKYNANYIGTGGTQFAGGTGNKAALAGGFGYGGIGDTSGEWNGTGGGGGWYGGGAGYSYQAAGGGGSGWCYTAENFANWQANNPTDAANYSVASSYYLYNTETFAGDENFYNPFGEYVVGRKGNGYAKITYIEE